MAVRRLLVLASLFGLFSVGCAHTELRCPRQAGAAWRQFESPHFAVTTDLSPPRARSLVGEFERIYRSFLDVTGWRFPGRGEPPGRMRVVVFANHSDYAAVAPRNSDGYFRPDLLVVDAVVVINNDGTHPPGEVFLHELTHRLIRYYVPNTPFGLNEGLAEYFSTFEVHGGNAYTGRPPRRIEMGSPVNLPNLNTLLTMESLEGLSPQQANAVYIGGWFLVHALALYYPAQLGEILGRMADGESFGSAFGGTFGKAGWSELQNRYIQSVAQVYFAGPGRVSVTSWKKPYQPPDVVDGVSDELPLGEGALHLLWADLELGRHDIAAQVALAQSHGGDSAQLAFMRGLLHLQHKELDAAQNDFAAAVEARPDEERYHLMLARLQTARFDSVVTKEAQAAVAHEIDWLAANGRSADSLAIAALYVCLRGDLTAARGHVKRALEVDPTNTRAQLALSMIDWQDGDLDGAITAMERAVRLAPEGTDTSGPRSLLVKLRAERRRRGR
jgi:tetratricopeptide (TPR) repeat protein